MPSALVCVGDFFLIYCRCTTLQNTRKKKKPKTNSFVCFRFLFVARDGFAEPKGRRSKTVLFIRTISFFAPRANHREYGIFLTTSVHQKKTPHGCLFLVDRGGFEPPKSETSDLQSDPFGRSGICPYGASRWNRTADRGIFSPLLYQLSYRGVSVDREEPEKRIKKWRPKRGSNS